MYFYAHDCSTNDFKYTSLWVSRVLKYPKKCLEDLATFFMSTWWAFWATWKIAQPIQPIFALPQFALKKPPWEFNFFHIFGFPSLCRHEKHCQILQTLFWVFQYSTNSQCCGIAVVCQLLGRCQVSGRESSMRCSINTMVNFVTAQSLPT